MVPSKSAVCNSTTFDASTNVNRLAATARSGFASNMILSEKNKGEGDTYMDAGGLLCKTD